MGWRHKPYLYPRVFQAYKNGAVIRGTPRSRRARMRAEIRGYTRACTRPCLRLNTHRGTSYTGWIASCRQAALSGYEILENLRAHATQSIPSTCTPIMEFIAWNTRSEWDRIVWYTGTSFPLFIVCRVQSSHARIKVFVCSRDG